VARARARAGLPIIGAHRLRHTAATEMRAAAAPLIEIGQVLQHRHTATTMIYARDDLAAQRSRDPPMAGELAVSAELRARAEKYLRIRRVLGVKLEDHARPLPASIDHLERIGATTPTIEAALEFATEPRDARPFRRKQRLSVVRGFLRWLHGLDPVVPVPSSDLLAYRRHRPTPYVMSGDDITVLLDAAMSGDDITVLLDAASRRPRPLSAATYHTLFALLTVTGMRVGEAVGLDIDDVDLDTGVITIRETKHRKQRRIPVHPTVVEALRDYVRPRHRLCPRPKQPCFFVSSALTT
jgi:integrase/recombinase XerD